MKSTKNKNKEEKKLPEKLKDELFLIDALPHPVAIVDTEFRVIAVNKAVTSFFKFSGTPVDRKCYEVFHILNRPHRNCPLTKTISEGKCERIEVFDHVLNKHLLIMTAPLFDGESVIGAIHSFIDFTERKEEELHYAEVVDIYAGVIKELKSREMKAQEVRDAFFNMLEDISESYKELEDLFLKLVSVMVNALDAKSPWTRGHSDRVSMYSEDIAKEMNIDEDEIKEIRLAGLLHDIGKIGTYDYLLDKPGALTKEEFDIVKMHPEQGVMILKDIKQLSNVIPLIKYHHEKLDGTGYPSGLKGTDIPVGAKILHVADSFDSMTSDRPYRKAPGFDHALSELKKYRGIQFDSDVVAAFMKVLKR